MSTIPLPDVDFAQLALHRFSTAGYLEMIEKGVLGPDDHVELIGGIIVEMAPAGIPHNGFLIALLRTLAPLFERFDISVQGTLVVAEGQVFDPDLIVLNKSMGNYQDRLPKSSDVVLVVEASESSLRRDQQVKLPVYASAGIPEYCIADLKRRSFIIHREPEGNQYKSVVALAGDDIVSPLAAPDLQFAVRQAFE
jgi:Uma2 family endonuclease